MATVAKLAADDLLIKWHVEIPGDKQVGRLLYLTPELAQRMDTALAGGSSWNIEESPAQQLDALTVVFVSGEPLTFQWQFKPLVHHKDGVWYLKTADIRLFGWFPFRDCFVAGAIGLTDLVKRSQLYHGFAGEVAHLRDNLPLDEPKFISGNDPNAVISNLSYPP